VNRRYSRNTNTRVEVQAQRNGCTNNSAEVENRPEDTNKPSLLNFSGIREDEGTLSGPQQTGANAEDSTSSNDETTSITVDIHSTVSLSIRSMRNKIEMLTGRRQYKGHNPSFQGTKSNEHQSYY
jgi:hypothetical protein